MSAHKPPGSVLSLAAPSRPGGARPGLIGGIGPSGGASRRARSSGDDHRGVPMRRVLALLAAAAAVAVVFARQARPQAPPSFVNWESPHVHPLDLTPDGTRLLAVNTADARLLVYDLTAPAPALLAAIPVGIDPVSVRA